MTNDDATCLDTSYRRANGRDYHAFDFFDAIYGALHVEKEETAREILQMLSDLNTLDKPAPLDWFKREWTVNEETCSSFWMTTYLLSYSTAWLTQVIGRNIYVLAMNDYVSENLQTESIVFTPGKEPLDYDAADRDIVLTWR